MNFVFVFETEQNRTLTKNKVKNETNLIWTISSSIKSNDQNAWKSRLIGNVLYNWYKCMYVRVDKIKWLANRRKKPKNRTKKKKQKHNLREYGGFRGKNDDKLQIFFFCGACGHEHAIGFQKK